MSNESELVPLQGEQFYSRRRVAVILDCSVETIGRRIKAGELKALRVGGLLRIPKSEIVRLLAGTDGSELGRVS